MAVALAAAAVVVTRPSSVVLLRRQRPKWLFKPLATSSSSSSSVPSRKLVLYSKPDCCLCDGLKEKLQAAFMLAGPDSLHDVELQVSPPHSFSVIVYEIPDIGFCQIRDITTNPEWERAYQYEIPVLAKVRSDGTEVSTTFNFVSHHSRNLFNLLRKTFVFW